MNLPLDLPWDAPRDVPEVWCARTGLVPYPDSLALQTRLESARQSERVPDVLLLLEHPPTYTRGRRSDGGRAADGRGLVPGAGDRDVRHRSRWAGDLSRPRPARRLSDRQPAALRRRRPRLHPPHGAGDRGLLAVYGIEAGTIEGLTGVWTPERRKIGSIGIHVSRGVTTHGFAINVNNDLQPFEWIVPCGIDHCRMSSVTRELGREQDMDRVRRHRVCAEFGRVYGRLPVPVTGSGSCREAAPHERLAACDALAREAGRRRDADQGVLPFRERKPRG